MLGRNREKETRWGERPIDIDIIFYDKRAHRFANSDTSAPAYAFEGFCAGAFAGACAGFVHPVLNKTISQIYERSWKT